MIVKVQYDTENNVRNRTLSFVNTHLRITIAKGFPSLLDWRNSSSCSRRGNDERMLRTINHWKVPPLWGGIVCRREITSAFHWPRALRKRWRQFFTVSNTCALNEYELIRGRLPIRPALFSSVTNDSIPLYAVAVLNAQVVASVFANLSVSEDFLL